MAKAAVVKKEASKKVTSTKPPKGYAGTQQEWDATSAAGKTYHIRKAEGLCVRCGKKALAGKLMCQTHTDYIRTFTAKNGDDAPKGKSTGKKAKNVPAKKAAKSPVKKKAYQQLGIKQLKDVSTETETVEE